MSSAPHGSSPRPKIAVVVSHPIQHFAPWHREVARRSDVDLRVFFCCDWGVQNVTDPGFGVSFAWDVPLLDGYPYEFLWTRRRPAHLTFLAVDNPGISAALDRYDPDVVQLFGYAHRTQWRAALWARRHRRPVLLFSDSDGSAPVQSWKKLFKEVIVRRFYRLIDGAMYIGDNNRAYHRYYGVAESALFRGCYPVDRERLLGSVPNGRDARDRLRRSLGIPADAFVVLFCGKMSTKKRPADLLKALSLLRLRMPAVWGIFVGDGPLRKQLCNDRDTPNVVFPGFVNQSDIPAYFAAADVLAVPSDRDPHPLVCTEAATFGLPLIVSDRVGCVGAHDTAQPGRNAIVFPFADVNGLAEAIGQLATSSLSREAMAAASRAIAETQDARSAATALADAVHAMLRARAGAVPSSTDDGLPAAGAECASDPPDSALR